MKSIVRRLYYHRHRPFTPWPRIVIGAPDSWDHVVSISNKNHEYGSCIWSPCGRFVAAQVTEAVEIRDQLTFELLSTLQPTETIHLLTGPLAYSPDGRSIACGSDTFIVIWDTQTGGVAEEIPCGPKNISMVWSLDGRKIGFIDTHKRVRTHDITSGTTASFETPLSTADPYIWPHERTFRIFTTAPSDSYLEAAVNIFEVGHTLIKIYSFTFTMLHTPLNISFSPTTCRFAISAGCELLIFENWSLIYQPLDCDHLSSHRFSPDGSFFAAVMEARIRVWEYSPRRYEQRWELLCPGRTDGFLQFSPTQWSILGSFGSILHGWRLNDIDIIPGTDRRDRKSVV